MKHKPWTMNAKAAGELEILMYDMIGQDWVGEGTSAKSFAQDLKDAGSVSKIHLRVNSPGGNVFDGIAIYNCLLSHGAKVTAQVDGVAASIAGVIIMGGWPTLLISPTRPTTWVPRSCAFGKGGYDAADTVSL